VSTVLVVEDTLSELELISSYLRDSGYTVIATDAKEALNKAVNQKLDAVVTDVVMPGMSGFELCRKLKTIQLLDNYQLLFVVLKPRN
jgi:twitching motility two-component system response regulator PilH